jgi:cation transport ATPase
MNDQNLNPEQQSPANPPSGSPSSPQDWREQRRFERWSRREARWQRHSMRRTGWFAGVVLIVLGLILLMEQMKIQFLTNWWALFILIPAFWAFIAAWDAYQDANKLTRRAAASLTVGILLTIFALIFLFNIEFGILWPVLLIIGGLALLATALLPG